MEPLIYIEQKEKDEATLLLKGLSNPNLRKQVFINALGAELLMKYMAQEGINVENVYNMHNIFKIREEFDIADVMLPNIHIDVRVVYDENIIFVPKSQFENNLVPDIYVVFNMAQDSTHVDFLGFIKSENIDKSKQNSEYYFIVKEQLVKPSEFIEFVKSFEGNTTEGFSEDLYNSAILLNDNDINDSKKRELIDALKKSSALREEMIEFDNFEWLSYNASKQDIIDAATPELPVVDEFEMFEEKDDFGFDDNSDNQELNTEDSFENAEFVDSSVEDLAVVDDLADNPDITTETIETVDNVADLSDIALPDDNVGFTQDLSINLIDDLPETTTAETESVDIPADLSVDFENEEQLQSDDSLDMPDLGISEDISMDIDNLELTAPMEDLNIEGDTPEISDELSIDTQEAEEPVINDFSQENIDSVEISESSDVNFEEQNDFELQGEDFKEGLENLSEVVDLPQNSLEEMSEIENSVPEIEDNLDSTGELVDLMPQVTEDFPADENPTFEEVSESDDMENLVSFEELDSQINTSDDNAASESAQSLGELVELESFANTESETIDSFENVEDFNPNLDNLQAESFENAAVISSDNQAPGEIAIDINKPEQEDLGVLYSSDEAEIKAETVKTPEKGKKAIVVAAAAAFVLAAAAAGYFVLNNKQQQQIAEVPPIEEPEPLLEEQPIPKDDAVKSETPAKEEKVEEAKPAQVQAKPIESAYMDVKKMGWSVPDYVTYNDDFRHYLQTLGKSLKLTLASDLLLATEYPYSDQIFVDIDLSSNGSVKNVVISKTSGSKQIDAIVLRTVKETANVIKPPAGVIVGDKFHMTLKIYL